MVKNIFISLAKKLTWAKVGYCEILHENQEKKMLDIHFPELLKHGSVEQVNKVAKFQIPQIIDLKLIYVIQSISSNSIIPQFSQKVANQMAYFEIIEIISRNLVSQFPQKIQRYLNWASQFLKSIMLYKRENFQQIVNYALFLRLLYNKQRANQFVEQSEFYRDILNKIKMTFYDQNYVQKEILDIRKSNMLFFG
ncbi:unnamed protein product (macronuclear) [Paramecium tetraurelia]|uniref:Ras-GEF domain-containing protein n=1 Tax=Paramecium tetraurelia TaxID=5888 RepID=A0DIZ8_PARTE|nr:uncharacterized protein GSPATT00017372001 [Paramecium tetraurelia]CAK83015.1 unnamed protein product [Paramecium tetraurelia]|eukprot:XP_001450412.1 hypothetical protein (macronuclear) [Paramecium tetraurelia strain d4-2]